MMKNPSVSEILKTLRRESLKDSYRIQKLHEDINAEFQKYFPGNYRVVEDFDTREGINLIFDSEEEKTLWMLKYWN